VIILSVRVETQGDERENMKMKGSRERDGQKEKR